MEESEEASRELPQGQDKLVLDIWSKHDISKSVEKVDTDYRKTG